MTKSSDNLKKKIIDEMTIDHSNTLENSFEIAKQFIRVTRSGSVSIIGESDVSAKDMITLYLIGKLYAAEAELSDYNAVESAELESELRLASGTIKSALKRLRDNHIIESTKVDGETRHKIRLSHLDKELDKYQSKYKDSGE